MYLPCVKCSCSELKLAKHLLTFFVLKKSRSGFDLVTGLISKQSFFQHASGLFSKVNHIYMGGIAGFLHS